MDRDSIMHDEALPDTEDAELLRQWRDSGDRSALDQLYARHAAALWRLAAALCGNAADADDAVQQTLINAMSASRQWRGGSVRSWLLSITVNCCREQGRRARRRTQHERSAPPPAELRPTADESQECLRQALAQLPAGYAQPVILAYLEGMTSDAIATALGLSPAAVRKRCERGLARLRSDRRLTSLDPALDPAKVSLLAWLKALPAHVPSGADPQRLVHALARTVRPPVPWWLWTAVATLGVALITVAMSCAWPMDRQAQAPAGAAHPPVPVGAAGAAAVDVDRAILDQRITISLRKSSLYQALADIDASLAGRRGFDHYPYYVSIPDEAVTRDFHDATVREVLEAFTAPTWSWRLAHRHLSVYRRHGPAIERTFSGWEYSLDELRNRILAWCHAPISEQKILDQLLDYNGYGYSDDTGLPIQMLDDDQQVVHAVEERLAAMRAGGVAWNSSAIITAGYLRLSAQVPALLELLSKDPAGDTPHSRKAVIEALGWIGDPRAVPALADIASSAGGWHIEHAIWVNDVYIATPSSDPQPTGYIASFVTERFSSITALCRIGDPTALSALRSVLADREAYAPRVSAARALAMLGCQEALPDIRAALQRKLQGPTLEHWDEDDPELSGLCWSLCHLDPDRGVADTLAMLPQVALRPAVLQGLSGVLDARLAPALLTLLRSDAGMARELVYQALHPANWRQDSQPDRYFCVVLTPQANTPQVLIAALSQPNDVGADWRNVVSVILGSTADLAAERFLAGRVTDRSLTPSMRSSAAYAIGCSRQMEAIRPLGDALVHDPSPEVRCAALVGIGMLSWFLQQNGPSLDGRLPATEAMLAEAMFHDPDPGVRRVAVSIGGTTPEWVDAMTTDLMSETDASVLKELILWIGQIRFRDDTDLNVLHVHDRCVAALACAPPAAQPGARNELNQWIDSQPGDGQTSTQLLVRLKRGLIQCQGTGVAAMNDLTVLLDANPPAAALPQPSGVRQF